MTMVNNVIGVINYVIAAHPSLLNYMIADNSSVAGVRQPAGEVLGPGSHPRLRCSRAKRQRHRWSARGSGRRMTVIQRV
jgi:hypothetical protein